MTLRPLLVSRIAGLVPGILVASFAWPLAEDLTGYAAFAILAPLAGGGLLAVRGYRTLVSLEQDRIVVRGLLWSRTIPRAQVVAITGYPALKWRRSSGHYIYTPLTMFTNAGALRVIEAHNEACLDRLADLVQQPAGAAEQGNPPPHRRGRQLPQTRPTNHAAPERRKSSPRTNAPLDQHHRPQPAAHTTSSA